MTANGDRDGRENALHEISAVKCSSWQSQKEIDFSNKTKKAIAEIDA